MENKLNTTKMMGLLEGFEYYYTGQEMDAMHAKTMEIYALLIEDGFTSTELAQDDMAIEDILIIDYAYEFAREDIMVDVAIRLNAMATVDNLLSSIEDVYTPLTEEQLTKQLMEGLKGMDVSNEEKESFVKQVKEQLEGENVSKIEIVEVDSDCECLHCEFDDSCVEACQTCLNCGKCIPDEFVDGDADEDIKFIVIHEEIDLVLGNKNIADPDIVFDSLADIQEYTEDIAEGIYEVIQEENLTNDLSVAVIDMIHTEEIQDSYASLGTFGEVIIDTLDVNEFVGLIGVVIIDNEANTILYAEMIKIAEVTAITE